MAPATSALAQRPQRRRPQASQLAVACAAGALAALSCVGCGGDSGSETTTLTTTTATTTTTTHFPIDSPCTPEGDVAKCVDYLNSQYTGYDPANESTPESGCTIFPTVSTVAMPLNYPVGIVFQPHAVERHLTKCAWQFDGAAFNRLNGGCGPGAGGLDCTRSGTAFSNVCPSSGKAADLQEECPEIERESCRSKPGSRYPDTCFWKGPAFYSSATPGVAPNLTEGSSEIREMMRQRVGDQGGKTGDGIPLVQYWNELTMDGKILEVMLTNNAPAAIAAIMYQKGDSQARGYAEQYNAALEKDYGQKVHLVELDMNMQIGEDGPGPFSAPQEAQLQVVV